MRFIFESVDSVAEFSNDDKIQATLKSGATGTTVHLYIYIYIQTTNND